MSLATLIQRAHLSPRDAERMPPLETNAFWISRCRGRNPARKAGETKIMTHQPSTAQNPQQDRSSIQLTFEPVNPAGAPTTCGAPPREYRGDPADSAPKSTATGLTLTVDLGTNTGWCLMIGSQLSESGTLQLASEEELEAQRREGRERTLDLRWVRFHAFLSKHLGGGVNRIVFEDVGFAPTRMQTQLWASLRAAIWAVANGSSIEVFCVPVATLKVFATGDPKAQKQQMLQALVDIDSEAFELSADVVIRRKSRLPMDHNEVDAIWLARFTAAVDRGERQFLSVFQRKALAQQARRKQRLAKKAQREAKRIAEKALKSKLRSALKAAGRCCGVFRLLAKGRTAVCSKCGNRLRLHVETAAT